MNSHSHLLLLLGLPIHAIPKEFLEETLNNIILKYPAEDYPAYVTTLSSLFVGQLAGYCSNQQEDKGQVTDTLRRASFLGIDSKFLQILSRLLGNPIQDRISSQDLLHAAAKLASLQNRSLYLVGKDLETCHQTAKALKEDYPRLRIAGFIAPNIHTEGKKIEISCEHDPWIVESINIAKPTILLMDLEHPKQEIWFDRIKHLVKAPLCIGLEGSFEEYLKNRFPVESKTSSSWNRMKPNLKSFARFACWIPPLLLFNTLNYVLSKAYSSKTRSARRRYLFLSEKESLFVIPFPSLIYQRAWLENPEWLEECLEYDYIVLDFTAVHHLDLAGMGLLYKVWIEARKCNKNLFILGISSDVKYLLKLHGAWDLVQYLVVQNTDEVLDRMSINHPISLKYEQEFLSIYQTKYSIILSFFGRIDKMQTPAHSLSQLTPLLSDKPCVVNLAYCSSISNQGFAFLLRLQKVVQSQGSQLLLSSPSPTVSNQIKASKLDAVFEIQET